MNFKELEQYCTVAAWLFLKDVCGAESFEIVLWEWTRKLQRWSRCWSGEMLTWPHACSRPRWDILFLRFLAMSNSRFLGTVFYLDRSYKDLNEGKRQFSLQLKATQCQWMATCVMRESQENHRLWNASTHFQWPFIPSFLCLRPVKISLTFIFVPF